MRPIDLRVVLVRSIYDSNIGASSRAMSNMGFEKLILINRQCEITYSAQQAAASGQNSLQNRTEYKSWDAFFASEPDGIRIAFSARDGRGRAVRDISETLAWLKINDRRLSEDVSDALIIYFIFGPEDWGLSAEDLELVHFNANIPTWGENSSLNLGQAVLLALFVFRKEWGGALRTQLDGQQPPRIQQNRQDIFPEQTLQTWLEEMGFDISSKKINVYTVLRRMLLQNVPTQKELGTLETVLQQSIRKLREWKQLKQMENPKSSLKSSLPDEQS